MYAGHGSQVANSKSSEPDKKDETIVPSDACKGTPDIRDKEIKKIFNEVLDRGVVLTLVFDCCHSGSIARGMPRPEKTRFLEPDPRDVADPEALALDRKSVAPWCCPLPRTCSPLLKRPMRTICLMARSVLP